MELARIGTEHAQLGRQLSAKVYQIPLTNVLIGTVAIKLDCFVFTIDPHFDKLEEHKLKRYPSS